MTKATLSARPLDARAAIQRVMQLMPIPGKSGEEQGVVAYILDQLKEAGAPDTAIKLDRAHQRSPRGGAVGNLFLKLPGNRRGPRRLLSAHLDTVPICVGSRPLRKKNLVRSAIPETGLGADNRAGCAVILSAAVEILRQRLPHPPLTFCWFVQEEVGLLGSRYVNRKLLGKPGLAFNWDGGAPGKLTIGATGGFRIQIDVFGVASHAGGAPEWGISAIAIAGQAIAQLHRDGWHGQIQKGRYRGTSNIGVIQGGQATNVVTDHVTLRAEARSHHPKFRQRIVREIEKAFKQAADTTRNIAGARGYIRFQGNLDYEAFRLPDDERCVLAAEQAAEAEGVDVQRAVANGGVDANWLTAHGIPAVTLGCGQLNQHMVSETLDLTQFEQACRIALRLATGQEQETPD